MDFALPPLIAGLVSFILIFLVLANNRKVKIVTPYILFNLSISLWNISLYFLYKSYKIYLFSHILAVSAMFIFSTFFHFIMVFTKKYKQPKIKYLIIISYFLSFIFIYIHFKYKIITSALKKFYWGYYPTVQIGDIIYTIIFLFYFLYIIIELKKLINTSKGITRTKYKYIYWGILIGFIGSLTNFLPLFHIQFYPLGNITSIFLIISISYILIIRKMINIRYFLKKLSNFILIVLLFSLIFVMVLKLLFKSHNITFLLLFYTYITVFFTYLLLKLLNSKHLTILISKKDRQLNLLKKFIKLYQMENKSILNNKDILNNLLKYLPIIFNVNKVFIRLYDNDKFIQGINYYKKKSHSTNIKIKSIPADNNDVILKYFDNIDVIMSVDDYEEKLNKGGTIRYQEKIAIKEIERLGYMLGIYIGDKNSIYGYILLSKKINGNMFDQYEKEALITLKHSINVLLLNLKNIEMIKRQTNQISDEIEKRNKLETIRLLASGVAHDFNNYLSTISTNIFLAREKLLKNKNINEIDEILDETQSALEQAIELTKQLLIFSKNTIKRKKIISPDKLLKSITRFILRGTNIDSTIEVQKNLWACEADETQFSEVLNNIIINSVQAMQSNGGKIKIKAENINLKKNEVALLKPGDYIKISISDTGKGIPRKNLNKIFDPYFTTKKTGSGIGLAVSYSIIKNHNGTIIADSTFNKGTTMHIYMPAVKKINKIKSINRVKNKKTLSKKQRGHILIMDDNLFVLKSAQRLFNYMGYNVTTAKNSKETVDLYSKSLISGDKFDIVILDLTIPGEPGGLETAKKLISIDNSVKCVLSSGKIININSNDRYNKIGFKGFLRKPYTIKEITDLFKKIM